MENQIKQISIKEMLTLFYNDHCKIYTGHLIELTFLQGRPLDEVVITLVSAGPQGIPGSPQVERKIKCKEAQINAKNILSKEESILKVIQKLINEEDKKETKF